MGVSVFATIFVFISAIRSLKEKRVSIDLLASIALAVSLIEREWLSAVFINLMITSARAFAYYVKARSHSAINSLLKLKPEKVKVERDGSIIDIPIASVKVGDLVIVELGGRVPVDGVVEYGEAEVDLSSLTGESLPVLKARGDKVLSFSTVSTGNLKIRAEKIGGETMFEKIVSLIGQAQQNKAPIYTTINKFANYYIIFTLLGALTVYLISHNISLVLGLLLVSCADDIAVATPLALMAAITHSAKHGSIVKGGDFLEGLSKVKTIVFDKTGTLTKGGLKVERIISFTNKPDEVLKIAAVVSSFSTHPIAKTIIAEAKRQKMALPQPEKFEEYAGRGMSAFLEGKKITTGKLPFLEAMGIKMSAKEKARIDEEITGGFNVTLVAQGNKLIGFIVLADEIKPNAKKAIADLKNLGINKIVMLTGDNGKVAQKVAALLEIDEFHANLLPDDKLQYLQKYLNKKTKVAMVGDGVNDAPVLAASDIGIAMGAIGTDAAIEAADVAMMKDDLSQIPQLIKIGHSTMSVIHLNLIIWGFTNVLGFVLVFTHVLGPSGAAFYNFITDFIPIVNSLRLFR